jgi:hypothetical protein
MATTKENKKSWKSHPNEVYLEAYKKMVHFSAKTVNSNASAAGVRIVDQTQLPYVSVSSVGPAVVPLDYFNGANTASSSNQINSLVLGNLHERFKDVNEEEINFIQEMIKNFEFAEFADDIDCHLKQVIMPDDAGNDFCLTPLHAAGLSRLINQHEKLIAKEISEKKTTVFRHAQMNYGGSNTQNIGGLANELKRPLFFSAPEEDMKIKAALAIYYKGFSYAPVQLVEQYLDWYDENCQADIAKNMQQKLEEQTRLTEIVKACFEQSNAIFSNLNLHKESLPNQTLISEDLDDVYQGLIYENKRDTDWFINFGNSLASFIKNRKRRKYINGNLVMIDALINNQDAITLQGLISDIAKSLSQTTIRNAFL